MIIGVTGSIGSGKSTVCRYLKERGFALVDADQISHALMAVDEVGYTTVVEAFGTAILHQDRQLNRSALAAIVFQDSARRRQLEEILHPLIRQRMLKETKLHLQNHELVFWEVPLLFETDFHKDCDRTVCVIAPQEQVIERVMMRSNLRKEDVIARLQAQMSTDWKQKLADYVIVNNGSKHQLFDKVDELLETLKLINV